MSARDKAKRATAAGLALASGGLASCPGCTGDPLPPPAIICDDLEAGQTLVALATRSQNSVSVSILHRPPPEMGRGWLSAQVGDVSGAELLSTDFTPTSSEVTVLLGIDPGGTAQASFRLVGTLGSNEGGTCRVSRLFTVTIEGEEVTVAEGLWKLPVLFPMYPSEIMVIGSQGKAVELKATTAYNGPSEVEWSVTSGSIEVTSENTALWTLPSSPGVHQVEAVIDYGDKGLAVETMFVEVAE